MPNLSRLYLTLATFFASVILATNSGVTFSISSCSIEAIVSTFYFSFEDWLSSEWSFWELEEEGHLSKSIHPFFCFFADSSFVNYCSLNLSFVDCIVCKTLIFFWYCFSLTYFKFSCTWFIFKWLITIIESPGFNPHSFTLKWDKFRSYGRFY